MHRTLYTFFLIWGLLVIACSKPADSDQPADYSVSSKDENVSLTFLLDENQMPAYTVRFGEQLAIDTSYLGIQLQDSSKLTGPWKVIGQETTPHSSVWEPIWGEKQRIWDEYTQLVIHLQEDKEKGGLLDLVFRVFDDGIGFRYEFPEQEGLTDFVIMAEQTEFAMTGDHTAWWIPANYDSYEYLYTESPISGIDAAKYTIDTHVAAERIPYNKAAHTPLTLKAESGLHISIHEAALTDYASMTLRVKEGTNTFSSVLVPYSDGSCVKTSAPFKSPWRTIQLAEDAAGLLTSSLILNLNEPNAIQGDLSWIKPSKYMGIWWGMHIGENTWEAGEKHGATTEEAKRYMDFASENNIQAVLIEGWNVGWERWFGEERDSLFDFYTPYPDFNIQEVVAYGKEKGVEMVAHHETASIIFNYERHMDSAYQLLQNLGIHAVKSGYVGPIIPKGEFHHGQWMVRHYRKALETAAAHQVMLDVHEPIKPTGICRTYPNMMTREGVRGMEYNAWSEGNPPNHTTILPFTRGLAGPIDYTPGIFDVMISLEDKKDNRVYSTLANQLALYVTLYSPLQMAADLPRNYKDQPAFQFIRDVPTDWAETEVLNAEIGQYVSIARKAKEGDRWFIGSVTNEEAREFAIPLDFLTGLKEYKATLYEDGADADWETNPTSINIREAVVKKGDTLTIKLAKGGGFAAMLKAE